MQLTFHGHACMMLTTDEGKRILVDPWIDGNPQTDLDLDVKCDAILVTHGHHDHSGDMIEISKRNNAPIIGMPELVHYAQSQGAPEGHPMNLGGKWTFDFGTVKVIHAQHSSSLEINGLPVYMGEACGYMVTVDDKTIYFAGDTSNFGDMSLFGNGFDIDVAVLPIGGNFTMGPEEAASAAKRLKAKHVVPIHYNTFPLIKQDPTAFAALLPEDVVEIVKPGESVTV